ncbi:MAG: hypothetical protein H6Q70_1094 [Firmicutes bacterium]|nr:hypothetical protein [Bacillota bacterium]
MPKRYLILGSVSIGLIAELSDLSGKYDQKLGEILSMDMVFTPLVIITIITIEGCYQLFKWGCKKS